MPGRCQPVTASDPWVEGEEWVGVHGHGSSLAFWCPFGRPNDTTQLPLGPRLRLPFRSTRIIDPTHAIGVVMAAGVGPRARLRLGYLRIRRVTADAHRRGQ